ncbi:hypothetical protein ACIPL1_12545 [Pseudomonas sp. NPDC090202]|uniref:hypothetical protein n=1 Tax=unclassified Pseudomonas TaxID=196821 RepID=UPI00380CA4C1
MKITFCITVLALSACISAYASVEPGALQQQTETDGHDVAARLNARYLDTSAACDGLPAYRCNGVLLRAVTFNPASHVWNPGSSAISRNGVSFSYLRADVGNDSIYGPQGFIIDPTPAATAYPLAVRCAYPANAGTDLITDSCRARCEQEGVASIESWRNRYAATPPKSCAFSTEPEQFQLSVQVRQAFPADWQFIWNEVIVAPWPQDIPAQLPLEALFYTRADGLVQAQSIQQDYRAATGKTLPLIKLTLKAAAPFSYVLEDQVPVQIASQT